MMITLVSPMIVPILLRSILLGFWCEVLGFLRLVMGVDVAIDSDLVLLSPDLSCREWLGYGASNRCITHYRSRGIDAQLHVSQKHKKMVSSPPSAPSLFHFVAMLLSAQKRSNFYSISLKMY